MKYKKDILVLISSLFGVAVFVGIPVAILGFVFGVGFGLGFGLVQ